MKMAQKYIFVRLPRDTFQLYKGIQLKMISDMKAYTGREIKLPMTKVFRAVAHPMLNENYIEIDMKKLVQFAKKK